MKKSTKIVLGVFVVPAVAFFSCAMIFGDASRVAAKIEKEKQVQAQVKKEEKPNYNTVWEAICHTSTGKRISILTAMNNGKSIVGNEYMEVTSSTGKEFVMTNYNNNNVAIVTQDFKGNAVLEYHTEYEVIFAKCTFEWGA